MSGCGENKAETEFYTNKCSRVYAYQKQVLLYKDCVHALLEEYTYKCGDEAALFLICAVLDIPHENGLTSRINDKTPPLTIGKFFRQLQMKQYERKSFAKSVTTDGQKCPEVHGANDRLGELQEDVSALREELHDIRAKLPESGNAHPIIRIKANRTTHKTALYRKKINI